MAGFAKCGENLISAFEIDPEVHLAGRLAESFLAGISGEPGIALVDVEIRAVGERIDAEGVRRIAKRGGKNFFGRAERAFRGEEIVGDAALAAVGKNQADGGAQDRGGDSEPGEDGLFAGDGPAHEDDEERHGDRKNLRAKYFPDGGSCGLEEGRVGLPPRHDGIDDDERRNHPEEVAIGGDARGGNEIEKIVGVGYAGSEKYESEGER